jgi:hypothetical protein
MKVLVAMAPRRLFLTSSFLILLIDSRFADILVNNLSAGVVFII